MYSDVQSRIRGKIELKREDEVIYKDVYGPKIGTNGVHLHVTGGNSYAKIFFFTLMAISIGLVGFIMMKNRNLSNQNKLLKEVLYFEKWINELHEKHNINQTAMSKSDIVPEPRENYAFGTNNGVSYLLQEITYSAPQINKIVDFERNTSITDFIESELKRADAEMNQYNFRQSLEIYGFLAEKYTNSPAVILGKMKALNLVADFTGSITIIKSLIAVCLQYLTLSELVSDEDFQMISYFCIDKMKSINLIHPAIHIHLQLIKRFDDDPVSRNALAETFINSKRLADAKYFIEENLKRWPTNGIALTYIGQIYDLSDNMEKAVHYLRLALETNEDELNYIAIYSALGEALLSLNRTHEARKIFRKAATEQIFPNEYQRPGVFIKELKAQPIWTKEETPYADIFELLESNWQRIRDEGLSALNMKDVYRTENETLTTRGLWQEFYLVANGNRVLENCRKVQFTCDLTKKFLLEHISYNGQVKFSVFYPGTKVKAHCGPHNARLRLHLGLKIPNGTQMRIVEDVRSWEEGKVLIFDDSFEHEVWHNGKSLRLILIVDLWHPQATDEHKEIIIRQ